MTARRRFYKDVTVTDDLGIALDGRPVKTPLKAPLRLPTRALADAVAAEWAEQGDDHQAADYDPDKAREYRDRPGRGHRPAIERRSSTTPIPTSSATAPTARRTSSPGM